MRTQLHHQVCCHLSFATLSHSLFIIFRDHSTTLSSHQQATMPPSLEQGASHSPSTVLASTASGNMDDALVLASTAVGNTEDVIVVGTPRAVAVEERPRKKSKSNNGKKHKKHPPTSDTDLEKQVNQVRDASGGGNIVDSSLRLT